MAYEMQTNGHPRSTSSSTQINNRRANDQAIIENPLTHVSDEELEADVRNFADTYLRSIKYDDILRGARVAKDIGLYDQVARDSDPNAGSHLPVQLTAEEKRALRRERDGPFSEKGMMVVIFTVSLAAFLQGFVQSSFNGASLYKQGFGLGSNDNTNSTGSTSTEDWQLGAANGSPWFFAALVGCPLSLPINYWFGRRGGMAVAAFLIFASSIGAIFVRTWLQLFCVRIVNGIGMGVKAVSTPILASETAVGFWRGSAILAWQLWVAFGIMMGFAFNLIFTTSNSDRLTLDLIQGAPLVPAAALFVTVLLLCPESPRYHLLKGPNYSHEKAYQMLRRVRNTELQALRDIYVVHKSIEQETMGEFHEDPSALLSPGFWWAVWDFLLQFRQLFEQRRLRNALISSSVVNLAQQLCGINIIAFYSGTLFSSFGTETITAMAYSLGLGTVNFLFALPAIKSIDTLGRRKWLLLTLPIMALFMGGAALTTRIENTDTKIGVLAFFLFMFAAAYSPGLGPIPFTLASESFPLSHREAGTAWAISINLLFAGLLAMFFPNIISGLHNGGTLGLFSGLNMVALVLVFLLVEETKRRNLEDLDLIFAVSKRRFMSFQIQVYLPWLFRRGFLGSKETEPQFYRDLIWDPERPDDKRPRIGGEPVGSLEEVNDAEAPGTRLETIRRPEYGPPDGRRVEHDGNPIEEIDGHSILEIDGTAREELEGTVHQGHRRQYGE
ncbi:hypothetical protein B0T10DRAFT_605400 [Thelonectria olida]|uniref:Major facilitator superfamily (MFS) profile domain-containing protein n=1 Tax=Thelonectria olida TaxID=1576542 RepID=A0A9P8W5R6_9HYPO|nr:hypothetical protein B0T10DRAFT_605400 [Thelonectria olida]